MKGALILAHGSRRESTVQTLLEIAGLVRKRLPETPIGIAFMEFAEPNIEAGLLELMGKGADEITVAPYFLFDGIHILEDIPKELDAFREKYPEVKISLGKTLGADSRLADILAERIGEPL